jgi:hypothetical protein
MDSNKTLAPTITIPVPTDVYCIMYSLFGLKCCNTEEKSDSKSDAQSHEAVSDVFVRSQLCYFWFPCVYAARSVVVFAKIQKFTLCLVFERFKMLMTFSCKIFMTMDFVYIIS